MNLASVLTNSIDASEATIEVAKKYFGREAKSKRNVIVAINSLSQLEEKRNNIISDLNDLRKQAAHCYADPALQQKLMLLLLEQSIEVYEADTIMELNMVDTNMQFISAALTTYHKELQYRKKAKKTAVLVAVLSILSIGLFLYFSKSLEVTSTSVISILQLPVPVLLWSVIGSFAAILDLFLLVIKQLRFLILGSSSINLPLILLLHRPGQLILVSVYGKGCSSVSFQQWHVLL